MLKKICYWFIGGGIFFAFCGYCDGPALGNTVIISGTILASVGLICLTKMEK